MPINIINHINVIKDKSNISIDVDKAFNKIKYAFMVKFLDRGLERTHLNKIKDIYDRPIANIS